MKTVKKPWGREVWWAQGPTYVGKFLHINKGHRLSLQYHKIKHETLYTLKGPYLLEVGTRRRTRRRRMKTGSVVELKPKTVHRMEARYGAVTLLEVSTPEVWDVVRLADDYRRGSNTAGRKALRRKTVRMKTVRRRTRK